MRKKKEIKTMKMNLSSLTNNLYTINKNIAMIKPIKILSKSVILFVLFATIHSFILTSLAFSQILGGEDQVSAYAIPLLKSESQEGKSLAYILNAYDAFLRYHQTGEPTPGAFLKKGYFELAMVGKTVSNDLFLHLSTCPSIRKLVLLDCNCSNKLNITKEQIKNIISLNITTFFEVDKVQTHPDCLFTALETSNIKQLCLEKVSSKQIGFISKMPFLSKLHLSGCTDKEIEQLALLKDKLEILALSNSTLALQSGISLSAFSKLQVLKLIDTNASPAFYKEMEDCNVQFYIYLGTDCNKKDCGLTLEMLKSLDQWKRLKKLYVSSNSPCEEKQLNESICELNRIVNSGKVFVRRKLFDKTPEFPETE